MNASPFPPINWRATFLHPFGMNLGVYIDERIIFPANKLAGYFLASLRDEFGESYRLTHHLSRQ
jgi:hypothetical protein